MSYILEALKKAQAERQIGETPTIHAPTLAPAPAERSSASRKPLLVGVGVLGGAVVIMGGMLLRQQPAAPAASVSGPAVTLASQPSSSPAQLAATLPATVAEAQRVNPPLTDAPTIPAAQPDAAQHPAAAAQLGPTAQAVGPKQPVGGRPVPAARASTSAAAWAQLADAAPASTSAKPVDAKPESASERKRAARDADADKPATASTTTAATAPAAAAPAQAAQDEHIQLLRDLPEPIQRAVPQVSMGGYMYSKNPADRLILIDKVLRKEGDEVAPGLQLEKLMPKAAVFVFRGYRYKVPL
jgi:general secretion pathway protein B